MWNDYLNEIPNFQEIYLKTKWNVDRPEQVQYI